MNSKALTSVINGSGPAAHDRYLVKTAVGSSHSWAFSRLKHKLSDLSSEDLEEFKVLDIGPGSGVCGEFLKGEGVTSLYAVEIDPETREHLSNTYRDIWESLEAGTQQQPDARYDVILCMDVLEHMTNPFEFYRQLVPLLKPGGLILISLPNIAHWSIRLQLLLGFFEYTPRGLLDLTHYQFFTRKRAKQLALSMPSLTISNSSCSVEPVEFVLPALLCNNPLFTLLKKAHHALAQLLPGLLGYQHLLEVSATQK